METTNQNWMKMEQRGCAFPAKMEILQTSSRRLILTRLRLAKKTKRKKGWNWELQRLEKLKMIFWKPLLNGQIHGQGWRD